MPISTIHQDETPKKRVRVLNNGIKWKPLLEKIAKNPLLFLTIPLIILLGTVASILYASNTEANLQIKILQDQLTTKQEDIPLMEKVEKLTLLPTTSNPRIQTVTNVSELPQDIFFSRIQSGDVMLIYEGLNRIVVYRPEKNLIIENGITDLEKFGLSSTKIGGGASSDGATADGGATSDEANDKDNSDKEKASETEKAKNEKTITIRIYNSTSTEGLASKLKDKFENNFVTFPIEIGEVGNAEGEYEESFVYIQGDVDKVKGFTIAEFAKAKVTTEKPANENLGSEDMLIVIGSNYSE